MRSLFVLIAIGLLFAGSFATADGVEGQIFRRQSNATAPCRGATACPKAFAYAQALLTSGWATTTDACVRDYSSFVCNPSYVECYKAYFNATELAAMEKDAGSKIDEWCSVTKTLVNNLGAVSQENKAKLCNALKAELADWDAGCLPANTTTNIFATATATAVAPTATSSPVATNSKPAGAVVNEVSMMSIALAVLVAVFAV